MPASTLAHGPDRKRPSPWPVLITALGVALLLALGTWQLERLGEKTALIERIQARIAAPPVPMPARFDDPAAWEYRRVSITGHFHHDQEMPLLARTRDGRLGVELVTPLERSDIKPGEGSGVVLVNRGWVPVDPGHGGQHPSGDIARPAGPVTVEGLLRRPVPPGWFQPDNDPAGNRWFRIDPAAMARKAGLGETAPLVLEAGPSADPAARPAGGVTRVDPANNHLQYAVTWYGLALALVIIHLVSRRHPR